MADGLKKKLLLDWRTPMLIEEPVFDKDVWTFELLINSLPSTVTDLVFVTSEKLKHSTIDYYVKTFRS